MRKHIQKAGQNEMLLGLFDLCVEKKWYLFTLLVVMIALVFFTSQTAKFIMLILMGALASVSTMYKKFIRIPPFLEFMTVTTVFVGIAYGPVVGAIYGATVSVLSEVINTCIDAFIIGYVPARAVVGATSGLVYATFPDLGVVWLGIIMTIIYNGVGQPLYLLQSDIELRIKAWTFIIGNFFANIIVFATLGLFLESVLL